LCIGLELCGRHPLLVALELLEEAARSQVRVALVRVAGVLHRAGGDFGALHQVHHLEVVALAGPGGDARVELGGVRQATLGAGQAQIGARSGRPIARQSAAHSASLVTAIEHQRSSPRQG
jgi:hypothetical protein